MIGIFLDLDGTLLNDENEIGKEDEEFIKSIDKNKFKIFLITGKGLDFAKKYHKQLKLNTWIISNHGQTMWEPSNNIKIEKFWNSKMIDSFFKKGFHYFSLQTNDELITNDERKFKFIHSNKTKKYTSKIEIKNVIQAYTYEYKKVSRLFKVHPWEYKGKNIFIYKLKKYDKYSGVKFITKKEKLEKIIYIGNGRSDIKSMKKSNISIAMKNSHSKTLKNASIISEKGNNENGVSFALRKILNNKI